MIPAAREAELGLRGPWILVFSPSGGGATFGPNIAVTPQAQFGMQCGEALEDVKSSARSLRS